MGTALVGDGLQAWPSPGPAAGAAQKRDLAAGFSSPSVAPRKEESPICGAMCLSQLLEARGQKFLLGLVEFILSSSQKSGHTPKLWSWFILVVEFNSTWTQRGKDTGKEASPVFLQIGPSVDT